jgi:predicted chitinase
METIMSRRRFRMSAVPETLEGRVLPTSINFVEPPDYADEDYWSILPNGGIVSDNSDVSVQGVIGYPLPPDVGYWGEYNSKDVYDLAFNFLKVPDVSLTLPALPGFSVYVKPDGNVDLLSINGGTADDYYGYSFDSGGTLALRADPQIMGPFFTADFHVSISVQFTGPGPITKTEYTIAAQVSGQSSTSQPDIAMVGASLDAGLTTASFQYAIQGNPGPFTVSLYQSADTTFDPANQSNELVDSQTITPPATSSGQGTFKLPASFVRDPERPNLLVVADPPSSVFPNGLIGESDETNNVAVIGASITVTSLSPVSGKDPRGAGISFSYTVQGYWTQAVTVNFYWATGPGFANLVGPDTTRSTAVPIYSYSIKAADLKTAGAHGPIYIPRSSFPDVPFGATHLVASVDPHGKNSVSTQLFRPITLADITSIVAPPPAPKAPSVPAGKLTAKQRKVLSASKARYKAALQNLENYETLAATLVDYLNSKEAFERLQINYAERRAAFIGQCAVETQNLTKPAERPSGYASSRSKYKGRGLIHLTSLDNYRRAGKFIGVDLVHNPDLLVTNPALGARAAGWFWSKYRSYSFNKYADQWDINSITSQVNTGSLKANERLADSDAALSVLSVF